MSVNDLERRVGALHKKLQTYSDELALALRYVQPDAASSLTKSRIVLEKLILSVYLSEMKREPRKSLLGDMLADNQFTKKIERRILTRMNAIRDMGNLGPHGERVQPSDAARVLEDLCEVLEWYAGRYPVATARGSEQEADDAPVVEDMPSGESKAGVVVSAGFSKPHAIDDDDAEGEELDGYAARVVHVHPQTGMLADVVIPVETPGATESITVVLCHKILGRSPCRFDVRVPERGEKPVQYLRLKGLIDNSPRVLRRRWLERALRPIGLFRRPADVVLRVHWMEMLQRYRGFTSQQESGCVAVVRVKSSGQRVVTQEAAGMLLGGRFSAILPVGSAVPCIVSKRLRTRRDDQTKIAVTPAVMGIDGQLRRLPKLRVSALPALRGVAWMECTFSVDADGRYTAYVRNPLNGMRIEDLVGPFVR